jgi:hypothetical protein
MADSTAMPEQSGSAYDEPKDVVQDASADIAQSQQAASGQGSWKMAAKVESNVPRARVSIIEVTGTVSNDLSKRPSNAGTDAFYCFD